MNRTFRRTMLCTCWLPILGMVVAVAIQAWRIKAWVAGFPMERDVAGASQNV